VFKIKVIELFFGNDWFEYKVIYKKRTTKYVSYENNELKKVGGLKNEFH
jgi:hypothetical protein